MKKYFLSATLMVHLLSTNNVVSNFDAAWHRATTQHMPLTYLSEVPQLPMPIFPPLLLPNLEFPEPRLAFSQPLHTLHNNIPHFDLGNLTSSLYAGGIILTIVMVSLFRHWGV